MAVGTIVFLTNETRVSLQDLYFNIKTAIKTVQRKINEQLRALRVQTIVTDHMTRIFGLPEAISEDVVASFSVRFLMDWNQGIYVYVCMSMYV